MYGDMDFELTEREPVYIERSWGLFKPGKARPVVVVRASSEDAARDLAVRDIRLTWGETVASKYLDSACEIRPVDSCAGHEVVTLGSVITREKASEKPKWR